MSTTQKLRDYVQEHHDVILGAHPFWDALAKQIDLCEYTYAYETSFLTDNLLTCYPRFSADDSTLADETDRLFFILLLKRLDQAKADFTHSQGYPVALKIFRTWTQYGTRDIPQRFAERFIPPLKWTYDNENKDIKHWIVSMVVESPALWNAFESRILDTFETTLSYEKAVHRHAPHLPGAYKNIDSRKMYALMCSVNTHANFTLLDMRSILRGFHNNALAWHTALAVCDLKDPTMVGSWMKMSQTFSALDLDPKNQDAWKFWHLLSDCTKDDESGRNLLLCLAETQHEMASAFADGWGIVDALYDGNARYEQAVWMHDKKTVDMLALPTCSSQEHTIDNVQ